MLINGTKAPDFTLVSQDGTEHSLKDYLGKPLTLIFVRGTFCPTTNRYLTEWQDFNRRIHNLGGNLLVINHDSVEQNKDLAERFGTKFPLLSDPEVKTSRHYETYIATKKSGEEYSEPAVVVIDKDGEIAYSVISSGPKGLPHPGDVAAVLIYMQAHDGKY